jgi:hypothetical protein
MPLIPREQHGPAASAQPETIGPIVDLPRHPANDRMPGNVPANDCAPLSKSDKSCARGVEIRAIPRNKHHPLAALDDHHRRRTARTALGSLVLAIAAKRNIP